METIAVPYFVMSAFCRSHVKRSPGGAGSTFSERTLWGRVPAASRLFGHNAAAATRLATASTLHAATGFRNGFFPAHSGVAWVGGSTTTFDGVTVVTGGGAGSSSGTLSG